MFLKGFTKCMPSTRAFDSSRRTNIYVLLAYALFAVATADSNKVNVN